MKKKSTIWFTVFIILAIIVLASCGDNANSSETLDVPTQNEFATESSAVETTEPDATEGTANETESLIATTSGQNVNPAPTNKPPVATTKPQPPTTIKSAQSNTKPIGATYLTNAEIESMGRQKGLKFFNYGDEYTYKINMASHQHGLIAPGKIVQFGYTGVIIRVKVDSVEGTPGCFIRYKKSIGDPPLRLTKEELEEALMVLDRLFANPLKNPMEGLSLKHYTFVEYYSE